MIVLLTLATWPETVRQLEIVLNYPRPIRVDYMILAWAVVPWLWLRDWPPRLSTDWYHDRSAPSRAGGHSSATTADSSHG